MRPTLFVILSLLACALAQQSGLPLAGWSGTTTGAFTYTQPNNSVTAPYVAFNYTFATSGVREVVVVAGESGTSPSWDPYVYVYTGSFNPLAPYPYFRQLGFWSGAYSEGPQVDDFVYFTAGTNYWFVVTGEDDEEDGDFALNIFESAATGNNAASPQWGGIEWDSTDYTCEDESETAPYARYTWVQNSTGRFDIIGGFDHNATFDDGEDDWDVVLALFLGNVTDTVITGGSPCENGVINGAGYDDYRSTTIFGAYLTQGTLYTVVFSSEETDAIGNWGIQVVPTRIAIVNNPAPANGFLQPEYELPCQADPDASGAPWYAFSFTAVANQGPVIVAGNFEFSTSVNYTYFDTVIFAYSGSNVGTPPSSCGPSGLLAYGDTYATVATTSAGSVYSVVVSSWDADTYEDEPIAAGIWVLSGTLVSNSAATLATTTTTTTTAGTGSTGTGATGSTGSTGTGATGTTGSTGTGATGTTGTSTGTHGNTTAAATTTSGAVSVCVSFVVLALSFALML